jgi:hypothetical protein
MVDLMKSFCDQNSSMVYRFVATKRKASTKFIGLSMDMLSTSREHMSREF